MDLKNQRTDEDDLSAAWIVVNTERTNGKFMILRGTFITVQGRHFLRLCDLGDFGINYDDNEQGSYIQVPIARDKLNPPQTSKRSTEGEVVVHRSGGAIRKLDGDCRP